METALADLQAEGLVSLTWLEGETWRDLQRAMRRGSWHIFHFIGHGGFNRANDEGFVVLSDQEGDPHYLSATQLGRLLADHQRTATGAAQCVRRRARQRSGRFLQHGRDSGASWPSGSPGDAISDRGSRGYRVFTHVLRGVGRRYARRCGDHGGAPGDQHRGDRNRWSGAFPCSICVRQTVRCSTCRDSRRHLEAVVSCAHRLL